MLKIADDRIRPVAAAILIAALGAAITAPPANAADIQVEQRTVSYADLDLTRREGVQSLKWRVNAAIYALCRTGYRWSLEEAIQQRTCLARARAEAAAQVERAI